MKACTLIVPITAGLGTQTVTGVVDKDGAAFVGKVGIIQGNATLNTLEAFFRQSYGFDILTNAYGEANDETNSAGLKIVCTGSAGNYSLIDERGQLTFGGQIMRLARISAFRSGEFDIQKDLNDRPGDSYIITILGGDDLTYGLQQAVGGVNAVGHTPEVVLLKNHLLFSASHGTSGGENSWFGWATRTSGQGVTSTAVIDGSKNSRYQRTNECLATLGGSIFTPPSIGDERAITAWSPTGVTLSGGGGTVAAALLSLGGIAAVAGVGTQPASQGTQELVTVTADYPNGVIPRVCFVMSAGAIANTSLDATIASWSFGMFDSVRQGGHWSSENQAVDTLPNGARYLSDADVMRFATTLNRGSSTFGAIVESAGFLDTSAFLRWTQVDGISRQYLWLILGEEYVPTPPPSPPSPIDTIRVPRWLLHRFDTKARFEQTG